MLTDDIVDYVAKGFHIPPKPEILDEVQRLAKVPNVDPAQIGACIEQDVGLSAAVLKTLNSPFYGMARTITDVRQATVLLGVNGIVNLVASHEIRNAFTKDCCISLERFWDSATDIAAAMVFTGKKVNPNTPFEYLHVAGLFHDCGIPAMATKFPDYVDALNEANSNYEKSVIEIEEERYKTNHAVVGYYIASSWGLPKEVCEVILRHHDTQALSSKSNQDFLWMYSCLKTACNVMERIRRNNDTRDWPIVKDIVLNTMGINDDDYLDLQEDISMQF